MVKYFNLARFAFFLKIHGPPRSKDELFGITKTRVIRVVSCQDDKFLSYHCVIPVDVISQQLILKISTFFRKVSYITSGTGFAKC